MLNRQYNHSTESILREYKSIAFKKSVRISKDYTSGTFSPEQPDESSSRVKQLEILVTLAFP